MGWVLEIVVQGIWEGAMMRAYKGYGWLGAIAAVTLPFSLVMLGAWLLLAR